MIRSQNQQEQIQTPKQKSGTQMSYLGIAIAIFAVSSQTSIAELTKETALGPGGAFLIESSCKSQGYLQKLESALVSDLEKTIEQLKSENLDKNQLWRLRTELKELAGLIYQSKNKLSKKIDPLYLTTKKVADVQVEITALERSIENLKISEKKNIAVLNAIKGSWGQRIKNFLLRKHKSSTLKSHQFYGRQLKANHEYAIEESKRTLKALKKVRDQQVNGIQSQEKLVSQLRKALLSSKLHKLYRKLKPQGVQLLIANVSIPETCKAEDFIAGSENETKQTSSCRFQEDSTLGIANQWMRISKATESFLKTPELQSASVIQKYNSELSSSFENWSKNAVRDLQYESGKNIKSLLEANTSKVVTAPTEVQPNPSPLPKPALLSLPPEYVGAASSKTAQDQATSKKKRRVRKKKHTTKESAAPETKSTSTVLSSSEKAIAPLSKTPVAFVSPTPQVTSSPTRPANPVSIMPLRMSSVRHESSVVANLETASDKSSKPGTPRLSRRHSSPTLTEDPASSHRSTPRLAESLSEEELFTEPATSRTPSLRSSTNSLVAAEEETSKATPPRAPTPPPMPMHLFGQPKVVVIQAKTKTQEIVQDKTPSIGGLRALEINAFTAALKAKSGELKHVEETDPPPASRKGMITLDINAFTEALKAKSGELRHIDEADPTDHKKARVEDGDDIGNVIARALLERRRMIRVNNDTSANDSDEDEDDDWMI